MTISKRSPSAARVMGAFSLVELLVVMAIIAVLAGLAFPVLSRMRATQEAAGSVSNFRQIGAGMMAYASENEGMLPPSNWLVTPRRAWWQFLHPTPEEQASGSPVYVNDAKVFKSPADRTKGEVSYGNCGHNAETIANGKRLAVLGDLTSSVGFVEYHHNDRRLREFWYIDYPLAIEPGAPNGTAYPHPGDKTSALFLDGHVQLLTYQELKAKRHTFVLE